MPTTTMRANSCGTPSASISAAHASRAIMLSVQNRSQLLKISALMQSGHAACISTKASLTSLTFAAAVLWIKVPADL